MSEAGAVARGPGEMIGNAGPGMLAGLRVIEIADERAEYTGLLLGRARRRSGQDRAAGRQRDAADRPVFRGPAGARTLAVLLELQSQQEIGRARSAEPGRAEQMMRLLEGADILLDASCGALNEVLGLDHAALNARFPALVTARMTPFGDDGPWKDFKGSDLIHLALGGPMMNCGYDPDPNFEYDTPPIAPQIWHAYHIAGEQLATGIIGALIHRERSGEGQDVSLAIHEAVSKNPEQDLMYWVMPAGAAVAADLPPRVRRTQPQPRHLPHQGRALVHYPRHGRTRLEEPRAAARQIQRAGRPAAAGSRGRSAGAPGARHRRRR